MWTRLKALIIKELLAVLRDPRGRMVLIVPPIMQLFVFAYAATMEVRNVDIAVLNRDGGAASIELISRLQGSPTFHRIVRVTRNEEMAEAVNMQRVLLAMHISPTFSADIAARRPTDIQLILDGRRSNASQLAGAYVSQIVTAYSADITLRAGAEPAEPIVPRFWFNPALDTQWFMVPNLIAVIAVLIGLIVTGLSVARERELGTFDQLMVSPLRTHEILVGKTVPPLIIGHVHCTFYLLAAVFWFGLPVHGALAMFYIGVFFYLTALIGIGLFISSLSATQQQAILGSFLFMIPATLTSGFATPIDNMPTWLQHVTVINPLRYFIAIVRGVFLKGLPLDEMVRNTIPLILIAIVTLSVAAWMFRRRME
ncbi:inner membrane transport permease YbhR [Variibacter gotjawalensis]|uniref:Inner membrane transport permease YbhR n=2 Tax=Variibacter gotjawalensis TaxID=1333996 RepID=A0A0S3PUG5_9BRAD|nr:ABC-2 type transport system permease protein [Variibacter gotjawalensis]RZS45916.1 ABC-2 type transport system permease protein [Variibacter gotjawalensis]BAT59591.1 inner membrane transport permease YbhR [Variibacter gotjawalensis]